MVVILYEEYDMKQTFIVHNTQYETDVSGGNFTVKSHPESYDVVFDSLPTSFTDKEVVLVDENVQKLYNISHDKIIVIKATEENKSIETVLDVCERLSTFDFDKGNTLVAIGGGIIQDIAAFTAKIYKRGIDWIFYPTTLLSQCDSCIGGKTALNFKNNKNQLALFSAPTKVVIDTNVLSTLSPLDIISGYGEIVKLFLVGGDFYVNRIHSVDIKTLIYYSLMIKKVIIENDEFELGDRKSLNYGHSFGHVIEPLTNYTIPHGEAVLLGIEIINQLFDKNPTITDLVSRFTSLDKIKHIDTDELVINLKNDKKVKNGVITFVRVPTPGTTVFQPTVINEELKTKLYEIFAR